MVWARRGPSTICLACYHPAASSTAAAGPVHFDDPCSCRLAGPHGANHVRPRPGRARGTPHLRLKPLSGDKSTAPRKLDALGDAAKLQFADCVTRYSHADWERKQKAEPACHAAMRYITIGGPSALPSDFLLCYPSHKRPSLSDIQELAGRGRLHTADDDIVLLVRDTTPPPTTSDEPVSYTHLTLPTTPYV